MPFIMFITAIVNIATGAQGDTIVTQYTVCVKYTGLNSQFTVRPTDKDVVFKDCLFAHHKEWQGC